MRYEGWQPGDPGAGWWSATASRRPSAPSSAACAPAPTSCPIRVLDDVQAVVDDPSLVQSVANQTSYAELARVLRALCVERLKA